MKTESTLTENGERLQANLTATFPHASRLALLRKRQAQLDEELQAGRGETMAVAEPPAAEGDEVDSVADKPA